MNKPVLLKMWKLSWWMKRKIKTESNLMDHKITYHGISEMFCAKPIETSIKQKLLSSMISRTSTILWLEINCKQEFTRLGLRRPPGVLF